MVASEDNLWFNVTGMGERRRERRKATGEVRTRRALFTCHRRSIIRRASVCIERGSFLVENVKFLCAGGVSQRETRGSPEGSWSEVHLAGVATSLKLVGSTSLRPTFDEARSWRRFFIQSNRWKKSESQCESVDFFARPVPVAVAVPVAVSRGRGHRFALMSGLLRPTVNQPSPAPASPPDSSGSESSAGQTHSLTRFTFR